MTDVMLPGRLGVPEMTLADDPRVDPRLGARAAALGIGGHGDQPPFDGSAPLEALREFISAAEQGFTELFATQFVDLTPVEGVERSEQTITGTDGQEIALAIHRPAGAAGDRPGVLHLHGGGMAIQSMRDAQFVYWRDRLAAAGLVVVGVEFRNAGGALGPHPFPTGLDDCTAALDWVHAHRRELGISKLVVSGESGGGNLTLATAIRANHEGRLGAIDGIYAQCPFISGTWDDPPPELPSLVENDDYFIGTTIMSIMAAAYDPDRTQRTNPLVWPYHASADDLRGFPPTVVSVNQLDPLRDEGLAFARKLADAGVTVASRTVNGTCHAGDLLFPGQIPEVFAATVRDLVGFANSL